MSLFNFFNPNVGKLALKGDIDRLLIFLVRASKSKIKRESAKKDILAAGHSVTNSLILCFEQSKSLKESEEWDIKKFVIETLGEIGNDRAVNYLISLLSELSDEIGGLFSFCKKWALMALSKVKPNEQIIETLLKALRDKNFGVRVEAKMALKKLGWIPSNDVDRALLILLDEYLHLSVSSKFQNLGQSAVEAIKIARNFDWKHSNKIMDKEIINTIKYLRERGFTIEETPEDIIAEARPFLCQSNSPEYDRKIADQLIKTPKQTIRAIKNRGWSKRGHEDEALNDFLMRLLGKIYSEFDDKDIRGDSMEAIIKAFVEPDDNTTGWTYLIDLATKVLAEYNISEARIRLNEIKRMADVPVIKTINYVLSKQW